MIELLGQYQKIRIENAENYFNRVLTPYFQKEEVAHDSSCVNTSQQNEITEIKNGHLLQSTQALLS